jgi:hypothetical protein
VPTRERAAAQGFADLVMGLAGASAGALSGVVVGSWGYPALTLLAALATVPLIVAVVRAGARERSRYGRGRFVPRSASDEGALEASADDG